MDDIRVYVNILSDSLRKKLDVLQELFSLIKKQNEILSEKDTEKVDIDGFDHAFEEKEKLIKKMQELDNGFDSVYKKVGSFLAENKQEYKQDILQMQNLIRSITDTGIKLESLEQQNKTKFNTFIRNKRHEISSFKQSNRVATSYYQNMSNQHREWQSHFLDKKK